MNQPAQRSHGFTLIEVLVSLALMSLIGTVLIASLELGGHTWQRVTRAVTDTEDITRAQQFLRERLGTIYPSERGDAALSSPGILTSAGDSLEFSGFAPHALDEGILRYRIALSPTEPGTLEVRFRRDRNGLPDFISSDWSHERLLTRLTSLSIQFFDKPSDSAGRWVDRWSDDSRLPRLIRVDVSFAPNDTRRWPPLYVEPRVDTNPSCVFDVVSRWCRDGA